MQPDSVEDENCGGCIRNINEDDTHNVAQRGGNEDSDISRDSTMEDLRADTHQEMVGISGNNNGGESGIEALAYVVEEPDIFIAESFSSSLLFPMPNWRNMRQHILLLVIAVALLALVAVVTWLGLKWKFIQVGISTPFTTPILTMSCLNFWTTLNTTSGPTFLRPSMSPT